MEFDVTIEIPEGQPQQVRDGPRDRPDPAGPHAVHLDPLPARLRLHRGHARPGRRPARRAGAARRADLPRVPDPLPRDRHVPHDRRGRRRRQGAVRAGRRPAQSSTCATSTTCPSSTGWRSSTSSRSTRTSSPASPSRAPPGWAGPRPRRRSRPPTRGCCDTRRCTPRTRGDGTGPTTEAGPTVGGRANEADEAVGVDVGLTDHVTACAARGSSGRRRCRAPT